MNAPAQLDDAITFGSMCSGIEAASVAFRPLGWKPAFFSEIEAFPVAVLKYRHAAADLRQGRTPGGVPLWGDMAALRVRHLRRFGIAMPDVLIAGTPCQGFSLAGLRGSLSDARSNLALAFVRIAHAIDHVRERAGKRGLVVAWENVPGVLSTEDNAFGCLLAGFVGADDPLVPQDAEWGAKPHFDHRSYNVHRTFGWKSCRWPSEGMAEGPRARAAWRVLDAQYFGLAQRRERVFLVVGFRDAIDPAAVLFERLGVSGNSPPRRQTRKDIAPTISARTSGGGGLGTDFDCDGGLVPQVSHPLLAKGNNSFDESLQSYVASSGDVSRCLNGGGDGPTGR